MEKFHIGFYTSNGKDKIKGNWKNSEAEVQEEADSPLYKNKLNYTLTAKASILKEDVVKIAEEKGLSVADVLSCI